MRRVIGHPEVLPIYLTPGDRIARIASDVRAAADKGRAGVMARIVAQGYESRGYKVDEDSWEMQVIDQPLGRPSMLMVTVRIERPD